MKLSYLIFIVLIALGCSKNMKEEENVGALGNVQFQYQQDLKIQMDTKTRNWSMNNQYVYDKTKNQEFLCILNAPTNSLNLYNLEGKKIKSIDYKKEGPDATGIITGFCYINDDSIFLINNQLNRFYLSSNNGKIINKYQLPALTEKIGRPWAEDGSEMLLSRKHLYVPSIAWIEYRKYPKKLFEKGINGIDLDLETGKFRFQIPYPNKNIFSENFFVSQAIYPKCTVNPNTNNLIYSFGADPNVYLYSLEGNLKGTYPIKTTKNETIVPIENKANLQDPTKEFIHYLNHLCYERLYYDSFRDLYYRVVKHALKQEFTGKDFQMGKKPDLRYSLVVCDKNFRFLDEIFLNKEIGSGALIITKKGVLLQKHSNDEDIMFFELYKVHVKI